MIDNPSEPARHGSVDSRERTPDRLRRLAQAYTAVICDALDHLGYRHQALDPSIRPIYPGARIAGVAVPVQLHTTGEIPEHPYENDMLMLEALQPGEVPVVAADAGNRAALWGELFSCAAQGRGVAGAVVEGYVRDAKKVAELQFPVFCRGFSPLDTLGRAETISFGSTVVCGGVEVRPRDYVVADEDGVVIIPALVIDDVLTFVGNKQAKESDAREDLLRGMGIQAAWKKHGVL